MALELIKTNYWIVERKSHEICDSPAIGCSEHIDQGSKTYGPFETKRQTETKLAEMMESLEKDGWHENDYGCWMRGNDDTWLSITKDIKELGVLNLPESEIESLLIKVLGESKLPSRVDSLIQALEAKNHKKD